MRTVNLLVALAALGFAAVSAAQDDLVIDKRFYVAPLGSYSMFGDERGLDDAIGYQLSIGKPLGRGTNMEFYGSFSDATSPADPDVEGSAEGSGELVGYGVTFLLFPNRLESPWYGVVGFGRGIATNPDYAPEEGQPAASDPESDSLDAGIGYMLGLGRWPLIGSGAKLRLEARYHLDKYSASNSQAYAEQFGTPVERNHQDTKFMIGLHIPIGTDPNPAPEPEQEEEAPPPVEVVRVEADGDQDGIPDRLDQCPGTPAGVAVDSRGCEPDSDGDGVGNSRDLCPGTAVGSDVDSQGCPADDDQDGVLNTNDQCPNTPAGASVLADGCALRGDCRLPGPGMKIDSRGCAATDTVVLKGVNFELGSDRLTPEARTILDSAAAALREVGQVTVEIGGHTDSSGNAAYNKQLSQRRADSVKRYLVDRGVNATILQTVGYGETAPIAPNTTEGGRELNRRVELKVVE